MRMRKITSILLTGAVCLSLAGCSVKSPRKLFRYAQRTYGDCELIDTEESDDYTRIVVQAYHAYNEYGETGDGKQFYVCDFLYYVNDYYESEWYNTFEETR